jgi:hypothetical protein
MSRGLMTVLISSVFLFGNVSTSAWSASEMSGAVQAQSVEVAVSTTNQPPLSPAGAAGIRQAQGFVQEYPLLTIALVAGVIAVVWILLDDDDEDSDTVPITNSN